MEWRNTSFSVDLIETAVRYLEFLDNADDLEKVLKGPVLTHAICRYEQLWLPFAKKYSTDDVMAPIDIHWVWCLHMLTPLEYRRDCRHNHNYNLDHSFKDTESLIPCTNNTVELWYKEYPKDGFNIIRNGEYVVPIRNKGTIDFKRKSRLSVDLTKAAESQMHFCYQVALPHFRDRKYLESALGRYKQFLCIKRDHPDEFLTPSVDIMLMWYAHMCSPTAYSKDITQICGRLLDNDIKVKPSKLLDQNFQLAQQKTQALWKQVSPVALTQPGTKLRPTNSKSDLFQMTFDDLSKCCVVVYKTQFTQVKIEGLPEGVKQFELVLYLDNADSTEPSSEILRLKGPTKIWTYTNKFLYNASYHTNMTIIMRQRNKVFCWKGEEDVAMGDVDMKQQIINKRDTFDIDCELKVRNSSLFNGLPGDARKTCIKVNAEYSIDSADIQVCDIYLTEVADFKERPARGTQFPVPVMDRRKQKIRSYYAIHRYMKANRQPCLLCEVTHIPEIIFSEVRIRMDDSRLVATSHLIGSSQLPAPSQVEGTDVSMSFDPELGERAMLIRNFQGDWGLCVGRWVAESHGQGYLEIRFMKLAAMSKVTGKTKVQRLEVRNAFVEFQSFSAHLGNGHVQINPSHNTIGENLATLWSIAVLHVLCSPCDLTRKLPVSIPTDVLPEVEVEHQEPKHPQYIEEGSCKMLQAAGLGTLVPNNDYVMKTYGSLTYDLQMDAQNVVFERMSTNDKLLRKESKRASGELEGATLVRKLKKKKSSKLTTYAENVKHGQFPMDDRTIEEVTELENTLGENTIEEENKMKPEPAADRKDTEKARRRKLRKKKSSTLDECLPMSDDSITKDDVAEYKFEKGKDGNRKFVTRVSSGLPDDYHPSEDTADEEEREDKEYLEVTQANEELSVSREHTALVRDIAEKKKAMIAKELGGETVNGEEGLNVTFQIGGGEDTGETGTDDTKSDTSSITRETRKMRLERLSKNREQLYPLTDEDADTKGTGNGGDRKKKSKRKRSRDDLKSTEAAKAASSGHKEIL